MRHELTDLPGEIEALQRSLDNSLAVSGADDPMVVLNRVHLAGRLHAAGRHNEVLSQLDAADSPAIKVIEAGHPGQGERLRLRALALHDLGRNHAAKAAAAGYADWCQTHLGPEHAQTKAAAKLLDSAAR